MSNQTNPLDELPNIESIEQTPQMSAEQELAMIKAPMYQAQKGAELLTETTINNLYKSLLEKTAVIQALQKEIAELKKA